MKLEMFPLLSISFIVYAALTVIGVTGMDALSAAANAPWHRALIAELPLYSGETWKVTGGDVFLFGSMGLLFVELVRATKTGTASIANHLLSFILFIIVLLCFILAKGFGTSVFFLFMTMTLLDPMAGFVVTTVTARRDISSEDKRVLIG